MPIGELASSPLVEDQDYEQSLEQCEHVISQFNCCILNFWSVRHASSNHQGVLFPVCSGQRAAADSVLLVKQ